MQRVFVCTGARNPRREASSAGFVTCSRLMLTALVPLYKLLVVPPYKSGCRRKFASIVEASRKIVEYCYWMQTGYTTPDTNIELGTNIEHTPPAM